MKGITYLVNDANEPIAVVIDLKMYGDELEDSLDGLEGQSRQDEPKENVDTVVTQLQIEKMVMHHKMFIKQLIRHK